MMFKFEKSGYSDRLENLLKFERKSSKYTGMQNIRILSRHHKMVLNWNNELRNKYRCNRWINDTRGCGYGCIVSEKRFTYK